MSKVLFLRLLWVGALTVLTAAAAVRVMQWLAVRIMAAPSRLLTSTEEPIIFTAVFVTIAVIVFAIVAAESLTPARAFSESHWSASSCRACRISPSRSACFATARGRSR